MRDDRKKEAGKGPWMDLSTYDRRRQLPLSHRFVFSYGYCPDCLAHFDERMAAAHRSTTAWEPLKGAARRLIGGADRNQRVGRRTEPGGGDRGCLRLGRIFCLLLPSIPA
jgi:hypothetical protein